MQRERDDASLVCKKILQSKNLTTRISRNSGVTY
jgi:hypothetical protein